MAVTIGGLIQDPDSLSYELAANTAISTKELSIDTANLIIKLTRVGNLTADGVTLKCLYSKLYEVWNTNPSLTPLAFPINPITDEQYELINGWNFDQQPNPATKITKTSNTISGSTTILSGTQVYPNNFNTANIFIGAYVAGTGLPSGTTIATANITVSNVTANGNIITTTANSISTATNTLTYWADVDWTFNLIRTGGWALKANVSSSSQEEWMGLITLGALGAEGLSTTTALLATTTSSNVINIDSTIATTLAVGSWIVGPNIPYGAVITSTSDATSGNITISKTVTSILVGSYITIRPYDTPYYVIGPNLNVKTNNIVMWGQANNPVKIYGDATHGNFDYRSASNVFTIFNRVQGYTYYQSSKADIGVSTLTYQTYRFPLATSVDVNDDITDASISTDGVTIDKDPYKNMSITWYATPQSRTINGTARNFSVIIDANTLVSTTYSTSTISDIYEFVKWKLRRSTNINANVSLTRAGSTTRLLVSYAGQTLTSSWGSDFTEDGGVYIDHFALADINNISFQDNTKTARTFYYVSFGTLAFSSYLAADATSATYKLFFNQINQGTIQTAGYTKSGSLSYGTRYAQIVKAFSYDLSGDNTKEIKGNLAGYATSVTYDFAYDNNTQTAWIANNAYYIGDEYNYFDGTSSTWYRVTANYTSGSSWASGVDGISATTINGPTVVLVACGRTNAQYFSITGTIQKSSTNTITAVGVQEKNYST